MNDKHPSDYTTQDLALAATLVALGHNLLGIERANPKRAGFCFTLNADLMAIIENYHEGKVCIEPRAYFTSLRLVKSRLYGDNGYSC